MWRKPKGLHSASTMYWLIYFLILLIGSSSLIYFTARAHRANKAAITNLLLITLSIFLTCLALEFYFKVFYAETDGFKTLARENWFDRYYNGTFNSLGFRDQEWPPEQVADKKKVMILGDSFVEGYGIKYPKDRFSNLLANKLGQNYVVFNVGRRGAGTLKEIKDLKEYPYKPDILVLTYFINDIDNTAREHNIDGPTTMPYSPPALDPLLENSYAFNFFYWRAYRVLLYKQEALRNDWRASAVKNPEVWAAHEQELQTIIDWSTENHVKLMLLIFPDLVQTDETRYIVRPIIQYFTKHQVPVLDVTPLLTNIPTNERIVSSLDPHPNEHLHALIAEALYQKLHDLAFVP